MIIPKFIEIKDSSGKRVAFLSPQADGLKDCYPDCRLNGESTFEFSLPANSPKISVLTPECQIWAGGKVFSLLKDDAIDITRDENNKLWAKFRAVERWNELDSSFIEPHLSNDPNTPTPADLATIIVGGGTNLSGGLYPTGSAGHALFAVLNGSGWTVGTVDVTGIHDLEMEKESRLALVKQIQNTWGGYLVWDSINKTVSLRSGTTWQNYTGFQIAYKKNEKTLTRTQSNRLVTKLYGFGKDNLDIALVNGGHKYVTNNSYTPRTYFGIYRNPDISDAQELKDKMTAELALICHPKYLYRGKIADLRTLPEYSHEDFTVGDMADVIDTDVAPDSPRSRIIRHKYNLFKPWDCELEIGDPEERLVEQLKASFNTTGFIQNTFTSSGYMSGGKLVDLSLTQQKLADAAVTTRAISNLAVDVNKLADLSVEAAKLADSSVIATKIANAAVGSAAIANAAIGTVHICTGVIQSAHIGDGQIISANIGIAAINSAHIQDLSVTTLKIGDTAITEAKLADLAVTNGKIADLAITNAKIADATITTAKIETLEVGRNVLMGPDATISWSKVTNQPAIPTLPGYITSTKITSTTIESPYITGGTITGGSINVQSIVNINPTEDGGINFGGDASISRHMASRSLILAAYGGVWILDEEVATKPWVQNNVIARFA